MKHLKTYEQKKSLEEQLFHSLEYSDIEKIKKLIEQGVNVNAKDDSNRTPLMYAAFSDRLDIIEILTNAGADWNTKNMAKLDFFDYANTYSKQQIIKLFPDKYKEYLQRKEIEKETDKYNL